MKKNKFLTKIVFPFLNYAFENFIDVIGNENFYKLFRKGLMIYYKISSYNLKIYNTPKNLKQPLLIVANHDDIFSGLYMICSLKQRIYPLVSMLAEPRWIKEPFRRIISRYSFIVENNNLESIKGLNQAVDCLEKGNNVLIFVNGPGSIGNYFTRDCPYKKGAAYIATQGMKRGIKFNIIPTFLRTGKFLNSETGIGSDKNIIIYFGDPINIEPNSKLEEITELFKKKIRSLEEKVTEKAT